MVHTSFYKKYVAAKLPETACTLNSKVNKSRFVAYRCIVKSVWVMLYRTSRWKKISRSLKTASLSTLVLGSVLLLLSQAFKPLLQPSDQGLALKVAGVALLLLGVCGMGARRWLQYRVDLARWAQRMKNREALSGMHGHPMDVLPPQSSSPRLGAKFTPKYVWNASVFAAIEWRRFQAVVDLLFTQAGFETRTIWLGGDGAAPIWLYSRNAQGPASVVQCRHVHATVVSVDELDAFLQVMHSQRLQRGTFVTSSIFTHEALAFAKANGIHAMDGQELLALIDKRSPKQQADLLKVAYQGDYWRPTCGRCDIKMLERKPLPGQPRFWGCLNAPRCKSRFPMV